jgi:hypothetical protein
MNFSGPVAVWSDHEAAVSDSTLKGSPHHLHEPPNLASHLCFGREFNEENRVSKHHSLCQGVVHFC